MQFYWACCVAEQMHKVAAVLRNKHCETTNAESTKVKDK